MKTVEEERVAATVRAAYIQGLRELADFLEERPELPVPTYTGVSAIVFADTRDEFRRIVQVAGGPLTSWSSNDWTVLCRTIGPHTYQITISNTKLLNPSLDTLTEIEQFLAEMRQVAQ